MSYSWKPEWSQKLEILFKGHFDIFDRALDTDKLSPNWKNLTLDQKVDLLIELFKWMAYYESSWNPLSQSVDVGKKDQKDTWSIGLMQMSVIDQTSYRTNTKWTYDDLLKPENNLHLAVLVMVRMIINKGKIFRALGESGYWAVIIEGGKYQKIDQILAKVKAKEATFKTPVKTPWMEIAEGEIGQKEIAGDKDNPRIVEYHSVTTLKAKDDETSWCASFTSWCLEKAGYKSTRSAWARDYLKYGSKLEKPEKGCIMVFERGSAGGTSHVGFWTGKENTTGYEILSGNQDDQVKYKYYPKNAFLGARWPVKG